MAVRNVNAVVNVLNVVTALVSNGFIQECAEKGATCIDVEKIAALRRQYNNEGDFRNDMSLALNALNRLFFDGVSQYRLTLQNKGRGRNGGWHIVAVHQGVTSKVTETDYDDDAHQEEQNQQEVTQKQVTKQEVTQNQDTTQNQSVVSIVKRPDKEKSVLVFIDKAKKDLLRNYCKSNGMWHRWHRRYGAWNVQKTGIAGLVDALKANGMKVRVDEHVRTWIEEERKQEKKTQGTNTITIKLVEV